MRRPVTSIALAVAAAAAPLPATAHAQDYGGPNCLTTDPPPVTAPAHRLHFGITPGAAGSVGAGQATVVPEDRSKADSELQALRPPGRALVMRLNRLFWADGEEGIRRFAALTDRYAAAGFEVESQVRYHPPEGHEGDIAGWERYVRAVVRELGSRPALTALSITNEANFPGSRNTSDGAYEGVVDALVRGHIVAREELDAMGRRDVRLGFSVMWRSDPDGDRRFWERIDERATPAFRAAVDYVGLQIYPGLVWPPAPRPGVSAGEEVIEAMTLLRRCFMPKAGLGDDVQAWISENGYATNLGRSEAAQDESLDSTVRDLHRWSGELGISDYRWFNLRDNDSDGADLFSAVGLLRDDYSRKPAFWTFRSLLAELGTDARTSSSDGAGPTAPRRRAVRLRWQVAHRPARGGARRFATSGRLLGASGSACRGTVAVRFKAGRKTISHRRAGVRPTCRFRSRVTFRVPHRFGRHRVLRVSVRFEGNPTLPPATSRVRRVGIR